MHRITDKLKNNRKPINISKYKDSLIRLIIIRESSYKDGHVLEEETRDLVQGQDKKLFRLRCEKR